MGDRGGMSQSQQPQPQQQQQLRGSPRTTPPTYYPPPNAMASGFPVFPDGAVLPTPPQPSSQPMTSSSSANTATSRTSSHYRNRPPPLRQQQPSQASHPGSSFTNNGNSNSSGGGGGGPRRGAGRSPGSLPTGYSTNRSVFPSQPQHFASTQYGGSSSGGGGSTPHNHNNNSNSNTMSGTSGLTAEFAQAVTISNRTSSPLLRTGGASHMPPLSFFPHDPAQVRALASQQQQQQRLTLSASLQQCDGGGGSTDAGGEAVSRGTHEMGVHSSMASASAFPASSSSSMPSRAGQAALDVTRPVLEDCLVDSSGGPARLHSPGSLVSPGAAGFHPPGATGFSQSYGHASPPVPTGRQGGQQRASPSSLAAATGGSGGGGALDTPHATSDTATITTRRDDRRGKGARVSSTDGTAHNANEEDVRLADTDAMASGAQEQEARREGRRDGERPRRRAPNGTRAGGARLRSRAADAVRSKREERKRGSGTGSTRKTGGGSGTRRKPKGTSPPSATSGATSAVAEPAPPPKSQSSQQQRPQQQQRQQKDTSKTRRRWQQKK